MMILVKDGVGISVLQSQCVFALIIANQVFDEFKQNLIVTSICEGKHKDGSLHYQGYAFDCRISHLQGISPYSIAEVLRGRLGPQFDVVLECDHLHVEYDYAKTL